MSIGVRIAAPFLMSAEKSAKAAVYLVSSPELEGVTENTYRKVNREGRQESLMTSLLPRGCGRSALN